MSEFIMDNQIWFIIIGVICIMALIGYVADKNNVGKKKERISKKEKTEPEETEKIIDPIEINNEEPEEIVMNSENNNPVLEGINQEIILEPAILPQQEVIVDSNEELSVPLNSVENSANVEAVASELGIDPSILTTPLEGGSSNDEFGIDNVPKLRTTENVENNEILGNDVWKF